MHYLEYFYQCSPYYISAIDKQLRAEVLCTISKLPKRSTQLELNQDITWLLGYQGWNFPSFPKSMPETAPADLGIGQLTKKQLESKRRRELCLASTILGHKWLIDFSKTFRQNRVYLEVQFGKKEALFMDFCKLRIAYYERRLSLGIEIVMCEPTRFFGHRRAAISGMADFNVAKETLPIIGLDCPIYLIGLSE